MKTTPLNELSPKRLIEIKNHSLVQYQHHLKHGNHEKAAEWRESYRTAIWEYSKIVKEREDEQLEILKDELRGRLTTHEYETLMNNMEEAELEALR